MYAVAYGKLPREHGVLFYPRRWNMNITPLHHVNGGSIPRCSQCGAQLPKDRVAHNIGNHEVRFFCRQADEADPDDSCFGRWRQTIRENTQ